MSEHGWTPAPRLGIIPLHPLSFGTVLGKSFAALRHNPKVLFGFAIVVQLVVLFASVAVIFATVFATFSRLETLSPSSPDYDTVLYGSIGWTVVVGFFVGLGSVAFTAIVQGVVAADVRAASLGEKASLSTLWRQMRPAIWRLISFSLLAILFGFVLIMIVFGALFAVAAGLLNIDPNLIAIVVIFGVLIGLGLIPLVIWIGTKLLLVPATLVIEHVTLREALVRSWRLTRGRFWFAFGVTAVISVIMGLAAQVISVPASLLTTVLAGIFTPTGDPTAGAVLGFVALMLIPQVFILILTAIQTVVLCTSAVLIYIDCRMRHEALDHDLLSFVERRARGASAEELGDPFTVGLGRDARWVRPAAAPPQYAPQPYAPQPPYAQPYAPQQYAPRAYPPPAAGMPPYAAPPAPPAGTPAPPVPPVVPPAPPASDSPWTPPGAQR